MARLTAAVLAGLAVLLIGSTFAQARPSSTQPRPPQSFMEVLLRVGKDGSISPSEFRQRGMGKIAIAQVVTQAKDGGRLTRLEADKIIDSFIVRARRNAPDPMIAICKQSPKYPACQNR